MDEISLIADERIEEMGMLNNKKSKLLEELKRLLDLIQKQETYLAVVTLFVKETINYEEIVKNLMEAKESLTQENHQLYAEMDCLFSVPVGNQGPYMPPCNQAPHTYSYSDFPMHSGAVPTENPMPYGGPNTENRPLNHSVSQMPNQSTRVQSASVPPTSQVVHNQLKLKEFEAALERMKSVNDNLSSHIKDLIETVLKQTMKRTEVEKENMSENLLWEMKKAEELQINIEELKANLSTRGSKICDRDKIICKLKTEVQDLRRTYEEKKNNSVFHIGGIKDNLLSIYDSVKSIYSENDLIQSDMDNLKQECEELLLQKTCTQQSREEFLFIILNQLGVIEKHVEALGENYEVRISGLTQRVDEISLIPDERIEEMGMLNNEKSNVCKLMEELDRAQDLYKKQKAELADMTLFLKEHINCEEMHKNLMKVKESFAQEKHQRQVRISYLREKINEFYLIADERIEMGMRNNEKSKLLEELIRLQKARKTFYVDL